MTGEPLDLTDIEARDFEEQPALFDGHHGPGAIQDRRALLAEVKRLRAHGHYFSTYCHHALHEDCRRTCKTCGSPCRCPCHPPSEDPQ